MKTHKHVGAAFVCLLAAACGGAPEEGGDHAEQAESPIINGNPSDPSVSPRIGVVEVRDRNTGTLGSGMLVRNDWIITARHLFFTQQAGNTPPQPIPFDRFDVNAPGHLDNPPVGTAQTTTIERLLFHRLGPRLEVALAHLDAPLTVIGSQLGGHRFQFFQGPFAGLVGQNVTCYGYGRTTATDPNSIGRLTFGDSQVFSVDGTVTGVTDPRIDASLHIWTELRRGAALPFRGDSGGPCFFGPNYVGMFSLFVDVPNPQSAFIVQSDAFQSWVDQILFEIGAAEFDDVTSVFTAASDFLTHDPVAGGNFAFKMGVRDGGAVGAVPVIVESPVVNNVPSFPPVLDFQGFTFQIAPRGVGDFNGDGMADVILTFDTLAQGQPVRIVGAALSPVSASSTVTELFRMPNVGWEIASIMDADGDGLSDILWRFVPVPGFYAVLGMGRNSAGNATPVSALPVPFFPLFDANGQPIPNSIDTAWRIVGAADFDRSLDSETGRIRDLTTADFVWQNQTTGDLEVWTVVVEQGVYRVLGRFQLFPRDPTRFEVAALADFTHDGMPDILWRDRSSQDGLLDVWALSFPQLNAGLLTTQIPVELPNGTQAAVTTLLDFVGPR